MTPEQHALRQAFHKRPEWAQLGEATDLFGGADDEIVAAVDGLKEGSLQLMAEGCKLAMQDWLVPENITEMMKLVPQRMFVMKMAQFFYLYGVMDATRAARFHQRERASEQN